MIVEILFPVSILFCYFSHLLFIKGGNDSRKNRTGKDLSFSKLTLVRLDMMRVRAAGAVPGKAPSSKANMNRIHGCLWPTIEEHQVCSPPTVLVKVLACCLPGPQHQTIHLAFESHIATPFAKSLLILRILWATHTMAVRCG